MNDEMAFESWMDSNGYIEEEMTIARRAWNAGEIHANERQHVTSEHWRCLAEMNIEQLQRSISNEAALREKYAIAQHAADCLEAKCNALEMDRNAFEDELKDVKSRLINPNHTTRSIFLANKNKRTE